jgi:uncharacterized membrane protein YeiH
MINGQFTLPVEIDLAATLLFGLTGGLAALKRGYDVIGLFALVFVTAVGGGLIRDGIFIQQGPPAVTTHGGYMMVIGAACLGSVLLRGHVLRFNKIIAWLDALGLGAYAVVGVQKSLNAGLTEGSAVLVGVINAAGGGLLRDVLVREEPLLFKPGQFYILAAVAGSVLFGLLAVQLKMEATEAAGLAIGTTFVFRLLAIQFNWKSTPVWKERSAPPPPPGSKQEPGSSAPAQPIEPIED